jgi:transposase
MDLFELTPQERLQLRELIDATDRTRLLQRAQALLWLAQGESPSAVADRLGVRRQTLYNWARRFHDRRGADLGERLDDAPRSGRPVTALGIIDPLLAEVIEDDPRHWGYRAAVWTAPLLRHFLAEHHGVVVCRQSVRSALGRLRYRWKRPRHRLARRPATWRQAKGA